MFPSRQEEFVNRAFPTTRFYELNVKLIDVTETINDDVDGDAKVTIMENHIWIH